MENVSEKPIVCCLFTYSLIILSGMIIENHIDRKLLYITIAILWVEDCLIWNNLIVIFNIANILERLWTSLDVIQTYSYRNA